MERPRVVTFNVASVDGRLTVAPDVLLLAGDPRWGEIAGEDDPYRWVRDVHEPDALLEGSGSFVERDAKAIAHPAPVSGDAELYQHFLPPGLVEAPGRRWMVVIDGRGRVRFHFKEWPDPAWAGWHVLVVTSRAVSPAHLAWLRSEGIPYLVAGDGPVDLSEALGELARALGVRTVVSTGGGELNGALVRAGLVDEVDLEVLPAVIGGRGTPALFDAPPLEIDEQPVQLHLISAEVVDGGHVRLRYEVRVEDR